MRTDILHKIIFQKRIEIARQKQAVGLQTLLALGSEQIERESLSLRKALEQSPGGWIAEFQRMNPSPGSIHPYVKLRETLQAFERKGALAHSIQTDSILHGGSFRDLRTARDCVRLPLIRKDVIIDTYQLFQSRALGADAILLTAAALTIDECRRLTDTAHGLRMEVVLEIDSEEELTYVDDEIDLISVKSQESQAYEIGKLLRGREPLAVFSKEQIDISTIDRLRSIGYCGFIAGKLSMQGV